MNRLTCLLLVIASISASCGSSSSETSRAQARDDSSQLALTETTDSLDLTTTASSQSEPPVYYDENNWSDELKGAELRAALDDAKKYSVTWGEGFDGFRRFSS